MRFPFTLALAAVVSAVSSPWSEIGQRRFGARPSPPWCGSAWRPLSLPGVQRLLDPYSADLSMPGAQDMLLVALLPWFRPVFCAPSNRLDRALRRPYVLFAAQREYPDPVFVMAGSILAWRPRPWREVAWTGAVLAGCLVFQDCCR